jgi:Glycosyl transferase family 2
MKTPTLGIFIPTHGRPELRRAIESAVPQMLPGDDLLIVGDTRDGPLPQTEAIVAEYGPQVRYLPYTDGQMSWGHAQAAYGIANLQTDWIFGNDDDDAFTPDAFAAIREAIAYAEYPRPLLFRFRSYIGGGFVFWHTPGMEWVRQGHIGGHCLVQPGHKHGKVGAYGSARYEGDFDWIVDTLQKWAPIEPLWCDHVISIQRPQEDR